MRPRVHAESSIDGVTNRNLAGEVVMSTPEVSVSVSFDLHDHANALVALREVVGRVVEQIEEAS